MIAFSDKRTSFSPCRTECSISIYGFFLAAKSLWSAERPVEALQALIYSLPRCQENHDLLKLELSVGGDKVKCESRLAKRTSGDMSPEASLGF